MNKFYTNAFRIGGAALVFTAAGCGHRERVTNADILDAVNSAQKPVCAPDLTDNTLGHIASPTATPVPSNN